MKLLRASCDCGFITRKARTGYRFDQWWFPVFSIDTGTLADVLAALPKEDRERIDRQSFDIHTRTPRGDSEARREASAQMELLSREIHDRFIANESRVLRDRYAAMTNCVFDPDPKTVFRCPACNRNSLILQQVSVIAFCRADCASEYEWLDSEMAGCPKCGYRPHRFRTEHEHRFTDKPRTICCCPCSSSTDSISHIDGYCPKCGELPRIYQVDTRAFCGIHHEQLVPYELPANFLLIEPEARFAGHQFPNAKLWGDASANQESIDGSYCQLCEADHQRWLQSHAMDDENQSG